MQQILVVHGADAFATYEEYVDSLKSYEVDLEKADLKKWKQNLQKELGKEFQVIRTLMPNQWDAKYLEWKIVFEKYIPHLRDDLIIIGHSMGGVFIAKYLSEENFPHKIKATFLVAAPYNKDEGRDLVEFTPPDSLTGLEDQGGKLFIYHSEDDPVVDFAELAKYQQKLPKANVKVFKDKGHFSQEDFPEIVNDIKEIL